MTMELLLIVILSVLLSVVVTPWVISLANHLGAIDHPQERKVHTRPIPRLGGLAVCTSFALSVGVLVAAFPEWFTIAFAGRYDWTLLVFSLFMVLGLGFYDDLRTINWARKFAFQWGAGTLVYLAGLQIHTISTPFNTGIIDLGLLSYPVTVLWVVGITNAFNLIDGLDGLASGIAMIASITIAGVALLSNDFMIAAIALTLAGAVLGFLVYNFNPARIFLGDSGSLVLGFVLAVISIHGSTKGSTAFSIIVPLLVLGLPVMDTLLAMIRRLLRSFLPGVTGTLSGCGRLRSMFLPDKGHIHHQLLSHGFSHRGAVIVLYIVSCVFGACAFAVTTRSVNVSLMLTCVGAAIVVGIRLLWNREMALFRNGVLLPLFDKPFFTRSIFHRAFDLGFIVVAFYASQQLAAYSGLGLARSTDFSWGLVATCVVQSFVFSLAGLYKGTLRLIGVGDIVRETKTIAAAVLLSAIVLPVFTHGVTFVHFTILWVLDFYFLATCVVGARVSFPVLNYLFRKQLVGGKRVLIYGADTFGMMTLQKILNYDTPEMDPVGFLDDNAALEGKMINGYPVYGGHWKLDGLLRKLNIHEILLATEDLKPEVWRRLNAAAQDYGVVIRTSKIQVEDCKWDEKLAETRSTSWRKAGRSRKLGTRVAEPALAHVSASI